MRMPYVMSWSGGMQWEFAENWVLEAQYQGQSGVGLDQSWDINAFRSIFRTTSRAEQDFPGDAELQAVTRNSDRSI